MKKLTAHKGRSLRLVRQDAMYRRLLVLMAASALIGTAWGASPSFRSDWPPAAGWPLPARHGRAAAMDRRTGRDQAGSSRRAPHTPNRDACRAIADMSPRQMYRWLKQERTHHVSFNSLVFEQKRNYTISGTQGSFDDEWTWPLDGKTLIAWGELGFTVFTFVFWRVSSSLGAALRARGLTKTSQTLQWTAPMRCLSTLCYYATSNRLRSRIW